MARITPVGGSESSGAGAELAGIMGRLPELFDNYFRFFYTAHEGGIVPARIKELARLKIARLNECPT